MPVKKIEVERALRNEIKRHKINDNPQISGDYKQGFLKGLKQAVVVVSQVRGTNG